MIITMVRAFVRSFFLQTLWNFERMQNIGFAYCVDPLLRLSHKTKEGYHAALRRHLGYFNVHPYLATAVIGVVYNSEKSAGAGEDSKVAETALVLKDSMGGAFGAIGDHVLWGTWRPFCAVLSMSVGLWIAYPTVADGGLAHSLFHTPAARLCAKWWAGGFLGLFNVVHLWLRWRGLQRSIAVGPQVVGWVQSLQLQPMAAQIRRLGLIAIAVMILVYLARWRSSDMLLWMFAVLLGTMVLKRWAVSGWVIFYTVCVASFVMTTLGVTWPY